MDDSYLENLLYESEGTSVDFKRDQYPFAKAADAQKAELLKDILAFANQTKAEKAYILIGAEEKRGERATIIGITDHLDEHSLQQFVNSKTNRPLDFRYEVKACDGKQLGIIEIPSQPIRYLRNDFPSLRKFICYVRRGSSTAEMSPDELVIHVEARTAQNRIPSLSVSFARIRQEYVIFSPLSNEKVDDHAHLETQSLALPESEYPIRSRLAAMYDYAKFGTFLDLAHRVRPLGLCVENPSGVAALDVRCLIRVKMSPNYRFFCQDEYPSFPVWPRERFGAGGCMMCLPKGDISLDSRPEDYGLVWCASKVLPGETLFSMGTFLVFPTMGAAIEFEATIFGENIPKPIVQTLRLNFDFKERSLSIAEYMSLLEHFKQCRSSIF